MLNLATQIDETAAAVRQQWSKTPMAGIILGSGLGGLADAIACDVAIDYDQLPNFPRTSAIAAAWCVARSTARR